MIITINPQTYIPESPALFDPSIVTKVWQVLASQYHYAPYYPKNIFDNFGRWAYGRPNPGEATT